MPSEPLAKPTLGRLAKLDPRHYWQAGAGEFVAWLRQPENLTLVGDAVGLPLVANEEQPASLEPLPAAADSEGAPAPTGAPIPAYLLCHEETTGARVLVVAQMEVSHPLVLGQLLAQGAALDVVAILWIASGFLPEHRAVLSWLNRLGQSGVRLLGIELELWGVGDAAMAVDFAPVCQPDSGPDADHGVGPESAAVRQPLEELEPEPEPDPEPEPLTEAQQQNLDFWTCLGEALDARGSIVKPGAPTPEEVAGFAIGRAGFRLYAGLDREAACLTIELHLADEDAHAHFYLLAEQQDLIEADLADSLVWDDQGEDGTCSIYVTLEAVDIEAIDRWPEYIGWLCDRLEAFHHAFSDRIKTLDAAAYTPLPSYSFNPLQGSLSLPG